MNRKGEVEMISKSKFKKIVACAAAASLIFTTGTGYAQQMTSADKVFKASSSQNLQNYVQDLSEDIGIRLMGTPNEKAAAEYIEGQLDSMGYNADVLTYQLPDSKKTDVAAFDIGGKQYYGNYYYDGKDMNALSNPKINDVSLAEGAAAEASYIDSWTIAEGDTVLVNYGLFTQLEKLTGTSAQTYIGQAVDKAEAAGAAALVVYNDTSIRSLSLKNITGNTVPVLTADVKLGELLKEGNVTSIDNISRSDSWNVCAVKEAETSEPSAIIHVTAHLDSVMGAPGATDNASSVAAMMELADLYKNTDTGNIEIRFVAVGGEEGGLNGSRAYVASLSEEEKAISINYNMDMLSTSWDGANAISLDISPEASGEGAVFNIAAAMIITGSDDISFTEGTENLRWYQYGASDHQSFQEAGVDAASMIRVTDDTDDIEPVNHTVSDNMDENYSAARHKECTDIVSGGIAMAIANGFTKVVEYDVKDGKVVVADADNLANLFDEINFVFEKEDGTTVSVTGFSSNDFAVLAPAGAELVSAEGIGEGTANVTGSYDRPQVEKYSSEMTVKEVVIDDSQTGDQDQDGNGNAAGNTGNTGNGDGTAAGGNGSDSTESNDDSTAETPQTGDSTDIAALIALMCASGAGVLALKKKKSDNQ